MSRLNVKNHLLASIMRDRTVEQTHDDHHHAPGDGVQLAVEEKEIVAQNDGDPSQLQPSSAQLQPGPAQRRRGDIDEGARRQWELSQRTHGSTGLKTRRSSTGLQPQPAPDRTTATAIYSGPSTVQRNLQDDINKQEILDREKAWRERQEKLLQRNEERDQLKRLTAEKWKEGATIVATLHADRRRQVYKIDRLEKERKEHTLAVALAQADRCRQYEEASRSEDQRLAAQTAQRKIEDSKREMETTARAQEASKRQAGVSQEVRPKPNTREEQREPLIASLKTKTASGPSVMTFEFRKGPSPSRSMSERHTEESSTPTSALTQTTLRDTSGPQKAHLDAASPKPDQSSLKDLLFASLNTQLRLPLTENVRPSDAYSQPTAESSPQHGIAREPPIASLTLSTNTAFSAMPEDKETSVEPWKEEGFIPDAATLRWITGRIGMGTVDLDVPPEVEKLILAIILEGIEIGGHYQKRQRAPPTAPKNEIARVDSSANDGDGVRNVETPALEDNVPLAPHLRPKVNMNEKSVKGKAKGLQNRDYRKVMENLREEWNYLGD